MNRLLQFAPYGVILAGCGLMYWYLSPTIECQGCLLAMVVGLGAFFSLTSYLASRASDN